MNQGNIGRILCREHELTNLAARIAVYPCRFVVTVIGF